MSAQDIRIVELLKQGRTLRAENSCNCSEYSAITYYDKISVYPVFPKKGEAPLQAAYQKMQANLADSIRANYESRQMMVAFTDIRSSRGGKDHTKTEIDAFWENAERSFLFMTMVNLSLCANLKEEMLRIRRILDRAHRNQYLLYLTYDYSEILIFFKGDSFQEYSSLVMEVGFGESSSYILDTITVCCFNRSDSNRKHDEALKICVQMGIKAYKEATEYLSKNNIEPDQVSWLLGRNDIAFVIDTDGIKLIQSFNKYRKEVSPAFSWLSTVNFIILIPKDPAVEAALAGKDKELCMKVILEKRIQSVCEKYEQICEAMNIRKDAVFIRMLGEIWGLVRNVQDSQLAQDLVVCILPELDDFLSYLERVLETGQPKGCHAGSLYNCINAFYINMLALISSTVHSNQEFVQIPHSALPGFEMPPKVMAYYGLIVREIIRAFQDEKNLYGVMLSPKLVDELEVDSLAIKELHTKALEDQKAQEEQRDQLLSVNIGESLLYDMRDTITTLGHEMAHFVGEYTRKREIRRQKILACYVYKLLNLLCEQFAQMLPTANNDTYTPNAEHFVVVARQISSRIVVESPCNRPLLRHLSPQIENLVGTVLYNEDYLKQIYTEVIHPTFEDIAREEFFEKQLCGKTGKNHTSNDFANVYVDGRMRPLFMEACRRCHEYWPIYTDKVEFKEYVGYLFSESYADLAMVMLFDMKVKDYIRVFARGMRGMKYPGEEVEDATELTRFIAVVRTIAKKNGGKEERWFTEAEEGEENWNRTLKVVAKLVTGNKLHALYKFCVEKKINVAYVAYLIEYLEECFDALTVQLHAEDGKYTDVVNKLQKIYKTVNRPSSILIQLNEIRDLEYSFLSQYASNQEPQA